MPHPTGVPDGSIPPRIVLPAFVLAAILAVVLTVTPAGDVPHAGQSWQVVVLNPESHTLAGDVWQILDLSALPGYAFAQTSTDTTSFITTWTTTAPNQTVTIPVGDSTASYNVDWGDGSADTGISGSQTHTYGAAGTYTVSISGGFERIHLGGGTAANAALLASVEQWGNMSWTSMEGAFAGASNMDYNATDVPDLSKVTDAGRHVPRRPRLQRRHLPLERLPSGLTCPTCSTTPSPSTATSPPGTSRQ